jgi:uncharacterized protein
LKKVVLDTNVLLVSLSTKSKLHWVFKDLVEGKYILCVTSDILMEYAEIIGQKMGGYASENILGVLDNLPNIERINTYFKFELLRDEDDNKFVNCALASNADFIVTHDKDFDVLKKIDFPKVIVINAEQFKQVLNKK